MTKDLVQSQFGQNAANYTTSPVHAKGQSLQRLIDVTTPSPAWRCLDVATATGHTALAFAPHVAHVVASDLTSEMLVEAEKLAGERDVSNISFVRADAEALPFEDASFDLVTCRIAPHHFPDPAAFVRESARVLKPSGLFALVDNLSPDQHTNPDLEGAETAKAADAYNAFEKLRDPSHGRALTQSEWIELVGEAGLDTWHIEHLAKQMSFNRWCKTMSVAAPVIETLREMITTADDATRAFLQPDVGRDDITFTLTELLLVARKR